MKCHLVAVGIGEGEGAAEGAVDRRGDDGVAVGGQGVVDGLNVCGVQQIAAPMPGWVTDVRSVPGMTSRSANAIGFVSKTTACGGPAGERTRPRYCS